MRFRHSMHSNVYRSRILICIGATFLFVSQVLGQGTKKDYESANSFGAKFGNKVLNESLDFGWYRGGAALWFAESSPATPTPTRKYFSIDIQTKKKTPAFDHVRLASALSQFSGKAISPERLPFRTLSFSEDGKKLLLRLEKPIEVNLETYEITSAQNNPQNGLKAWSPNEVTRSGGGGEQTEIRFYNDSNEPLKILWLQDDGATREYKSLLPKQEWSTQTWETHFWLVTKTDGTRLAVYKPSRNGGTAYLDGKRVTGSGPRRPRQNPDIPWIIRPSADKIQVINKNQPDLNFEFPQPTLGSSFSNEVSISEDGSTALCFNRTKEQDHPLNIVQTTPPDQLQPKLTSRQYAKPGDELAKETPIMVDLKNRKFITFDQYQSQINNPFEISIKGWATNNKAWILYNERGHQNLRLLELNAETGTMRPVIDEHSNTFIDWNGKSDLRILTNKKEAIFQSERSGWSHYYLYDLETGTVKNSITKGNWVVRGIDKVDENARQLWFRASGITAGQDPYQVHFCRVNFDGTGLIQLTQGNGNHRVEFSPDEKTLVDTYSRPDMPPVHELRSATDGQLISELTKSDTTELLKSGFKMPRVFSVKGRDGITDIWGHVYFPSNYDPVKKYPVVEDIYAGPHSSHVPKNFHTNASGMQIAELGFIVVRIDGMGTSNRSKAFHDVCWKNIADAGFPDRILWMKEVAKQIPSMDLNRVGIYGTSAGGQNTLHALLLHGDFYKVGIADCGCYDNRMDKIWWNEQWMGWPIGPHYEAQSCRTLARNLSGKLLLLLGEMDTNVDPASTYQVIDALIKANKDFDFVTIPNVGHGAAGHPYGKRRLQDFLVRNLLGVEPRIK
jgi:dipeptidyl-peptidase-4